MASCMSTTKGSTRTSNRYISDFVLADDRLNALQDDAFDHLRAPYRTVNDIRITATKDNANSVRVALQTPPLLGKEPYSTEKAGSRFDLKFRIKARDVDRFKKALKARGLVSRESIPGFNARTERVQGNKVLAADKRMSTATVVVEFDKDTDEPVSSTQVRLVRVRYLVRTNIPSPEQSSHGRRRYAASLSYVESGTDTKSSLEQLHRRRRDRDRAHIAAHD